MKVVSVSRKKKSKKKAAVPERPVDPLQSEERSSVAITVAWMLATLACLMAEAVWVVSEVAIRVTSADPSRHPLIIVPDMMRLVAVCTGVLALLLLPVVLRVRKSPPPRAITVFSLVAACLPLAALVLRAILSA